MNIIQSDIKTMDSSELRDLINECRLGVEQPIRLNKLNEKIIDELEGEHYTKSVVQNVNNTESVIYHLTVEQCTLIGMRESKTVRRSILAKLKELESNQAPAIPQTYAAALIEAGRLAQVAEEQAEQLAIAAPKVEYHDKVLSSDNGLLTTEIAAEFNMSAIKLNRLLQDLKIQRKVGGRWVLTAAMMGQNLTTEETFIDENGKTRHSMKWSEAGRKLIHELMEGV